MLEFKNLVYLDVQKTGSRFVAEFFRTFVDGTEIKNEIHRPAGPRQQDKLYVISTRDPLEQYYSLYRFGCYGGGHFRKLLVNAGHGELYDKTLQGFSRWLNFVTGQMDERKEFFPRHTHSIMKIAGLQTVRFLTLALPEPDLSFATAQTRGEIMRDYRRNALPDIFLHQETLNDDLARLAQGHHRALFKNTDNVVRYLAETPKIKFNRALELYSCRHPRRDRDESAKARMVSVRCAQRSLKELRTRSARPLKT